MQLVRDFGFQYFILGLLPHVLFSVSAYNFDPSSYSLENVECEAHNRAENIWKSIDIYYADVNPSASKVLLMVHGWPGLWSSWSNQILEFENDYRMIIPNLRGFGASQHPGDVESSSTMGDLVGDLMCVLHNADVKTAICVGHDWGAQVCWEFARMRPDVIEAVSASVLAYISPTLPELPISQLLNMLPRLAYQLVLEHASEAAIELDQDIRRTIRAVLRTAESPPPDDFLKSTKRMLEGWDDVEIIPPSPFLSVEEEDYWVEQYSIQGFENTLYFYAKTNRKLNSIQAISQGNDTIPQPAMVIFPTEDPVADWEKVADYLHSYKHVPNMQIEKIPTAHWPQLEAPKKFNELLRAFLKTLPDVYIYKNPDIDVAAAHTTTIARNRDEL